MIDYRVAIIPVTAIRQNCALVWDATTKQAIVVDPGGEAGRILQAIDKLGLSVETIVLTHGHLDHAGGARALKEEMNRARDRAGLAPLELIGPDPADRFLLDRIEEAAASFGMEGMLNVTPDRFLAEGETVEVGGLRFRVLHTPGHTPGHLSFVEETVRFAIVGDVLFRGSVGRTDFEYGDHATLIASIRDKLLPLGDDIFFICGHGEGSTLGHERLTNPFLVG